MVNYNRIFEILLNPQSVLFDNLIRQKRLLSKKEAQERSKKNRASVRRFGNLVLKSERKNSMHKN